MEAKSKNKIHNINTNSDSLKKFTIPRKRTSDSAYLEICRTDWREYSFIQSTLEGSKLDSSYQLNLLWNFGDVKLVHNVKIEQRFAAKRSEMRQEGRRRKEMEEITFFFVTSHKTALKLYQDGLSINSSDINALGNPAYGVYLHRHIDVLLNYHKLNNLAAETVLFFKLHQLPQVIPLTHTSDGLD
ncbi:protein TASOR-like [Hemitrygon akajei]|uniref:protein TASOR-like n=1 Tax=Hemitrygon akajei TaxID=2704970 RepID=UPI003BF9BEE8